MLTLNRDGWLLFATRFIRLFAYGALSVVLVFYLVGLGLSESQTGLLLTATLAGDTVISLYLTTQADRIGRRRMLVAGAALMTAAGLVFAFTHEFWLLVVAGTIGVISPSGNEVGPFLAIEQAVLAQNVAAQRRTSVFAWYQLAGSLATAAGAALCGYAMQAVQGQGLPPAQGYRAVFLAYAALGLVLAFLFLRLSPASEAPRAAGSGPPTRMFMGLHRSRRVVLKLSSLFALDAFAGGFVVQSLIVLWFKIRFDTDLATLGTIFLATNVLAGFSALAASALARRFGLFNTMVYSHVPSNILLILVPFMPNLPLAVTVLLLRFAISQMDVPARQSYTLAVVDPDERSAAAGVTGVARTIGASISPALAGLVMSSAAGSIFVISGALKLVYDGLLYRMFSHLRAPEECEKPIDHRR